MNGRVSIGYEFVMPLATARLIFAGGPENARGSLMTFVRLGHEIFLLRFFGLKDEATYVRRFSAFQTLPVTHPGDRAGFACMQVLREVLSLLDAMDGNCASNGDSDGSCSSCSGCATLNSC